MDSCSTGCSSSCLCVTSAWSSWWASPCIFCRPSFFVVSVYVAWSVVSFFFFLTVLFVLSSCIFLSIFGIRVDFGQPGDIFDLLLYSYNFFQNALSCPCVGLLQLLFLQQCILVWCPKFLELTLDLALVCLGEECGSPHIGVCPPCKTCFLKW